MEDSIKEKIIFIDLAIDEVIKNLQNGIEIKEYQIDNIKIVKRSPFELISELRKIKNVLVKDAKKAKQNTFVIFLQILRFKSEII